jgi:hypothetical protein
MLGLSKFLFQLLPLTQAYRKDDWEKTTVLSQKLENNFGLISMSLEKNQYIK